MRMRRAALAAFAPLLLAAAFACTGGDAPRPPPATPVVTTEDGGTPAPTATATPDAAERPTPETAARATPEGAATPDAAPGQQCIDGGAVGEGGGALASDCTTLLSLRDTLRGTAALNWSATLPIASWEGVTVSGTPARVTALALATRGLDGRLPPALGNLTALTILDLSSNKLGGAIPTELANLDALTALFLGENELAGCLPVALLALARHDLASLGLEETCAPPPTTNLPYNLHTTGAVMAPGSYAFLSDVNDLGSTLDWYVHQGTFGFLVHQSDADGVSRAALYDTVAAGDTVDWWRGEACSIRFSVREVKPDPAGSPARKLLVMEYVHSIGFSCSGPPLADAPQQVEFRWRPPPWKMGPDGIRQIQNEPVTGPGRYRLDGASEVVIRIPAGVTIEVRGGGYAGGVYSLAVVDVETGARLSFDSDTGAVTGRWIPDDVADKAGVNALFDQIIASVEIPGWGGSE